MTAEDLSMVNLHATGSGGWSWTAYCKPHEMWRSNKGVADFWLCLEELQQCLHESTVAEKVGIPLADDAPAEAFGGSQRASGGIKSKPAVGGKKKKKQRGWRRPSASDG